MAKVKVKFDEIKFLKGKTKKEEVDSLTDSEINEAALSDPDSAVPTEDELNEFQKITILSKCE